jgi:hypothetical protein
MYDDPLIRSVSYDAVVYISVNSRRIFQSQFTFERENGLAASKFIFCGA